MPDEGQIAYYSNEYGNHDIFLADVGSGKHFPLTRDPSDDLMPAWSSDGALLAFVSTRGPTRELYVMNADGTHLRQLTVGGYDVFGPVWSPDNNLIAFQSYRLGTQDVYVYDFTTGLVRQVSERAGSYTYSAAPVWSPDSQSLVFIADDFRDPELFMASGGEVVPLTRNTINDWDPAWSPDGQWLAYHANPEANVDLFALHVASGQVVRLTYHLSRDWLPQWSPDGRYISFLSERDGSTDLYLLETQCLLEAAQGLHLVTDQAGPVEGLCNGDATQLGAAPANGDVLSWSPDSRSIVYVGIADGNRELFLLEAACADDMNCDRNPRRLTHNGAIDQGPVWRP